MLAEMKMEFVLRTMGLWVDFEQENDMIKFTF